MKKIPIALLSLCLLVSAGAAFSAAPDLEPLVAPGARLDSGALARFDEVFYDFDLFELDTAEIAGVVQRAGALSIHLGNRTYELELELNDLRAPGYRAALMHEGREVEIKPGPAVTYRGALVGDPEAIVRLSIAPDRFEGYVKTAHEWVFIDPARRIAERAPANAFVVYRDSDVKPSASGLCGSDHLEDVAGNLGIETLVEPPQTRAPRRLQVATEHDGQFYNRYPGSWAAQSQSILNGVDGIYRADLNLFISITYQQAWTSVSGDPYTSLNAQTTLTQFRSWWQANRGGTVRDTAHMFSGKNFSGGTIGIAWVGVVCNRPDLSYGVSEDQFSSFLNRQLTAHEIGHNLSARHDNQSPVCPGVSCNNSGPVMCSFIQSNGTNRFSGCSISSVNNHVANNGFCL